MATSTTSGIYTYQWEGIIEIYYSIIGSDFQLFERIESDIDNIREKLRGSFNTIYSQISMMDDISYTKEDVFLIIDIPFILYIREG